MVVALNNIMRGLNKLSPNLDNIKDDLAKYPEILGEAIQCIFRKHGVSNGYDIIRKATQNKIFKNEEYFLAHILGICSLKGVPLEVVREIQLLTVEGYIGKV